MRSLVFVLLEARAAVADRVLGALSRSGVGDHVRHVTTREGLRSALDRGLADAVIAGAAERGDAASFVADARAIAPETPLVLLVEPPLEDAFERLAEGAAACVPASRLDHLAGALLRAVAAAERRREERASARARDELLAHVAHQLRTPASALLGWTALLSDTRVDDATRARAAETIARNTKIQARMLDDLVDLSRLFARTLDLDRAEIDLPIAVAAAVARARSQADDAGVALTARLDPAAGAALVDPARLDRITRELIENAVRATPRGGRVDVRLTRDGDALVLAVEDSGAGIDPAALPLIFEGPLRRAPARHGLGVGLLIARRLAEAHGGTLVAESPGVGLGATFTARLPAIPR